MEHLNLSVGITLLLGVPMRKKSLHCIEIDEFIKKLDYFKCREKCTHTYKLVYLRILIRTFIGIGRHLKSFQLNSTPVVD